MLRRLGLGAGMAVVLGLWWLLAPALAPHEPPSADGAIALPSGLEARLQEMIWDRPGGGLVYRYRFVAPGLKEGEALDQMMADLEYLCTSYALPRLPDSGPRPKQIIISLANRESVFGEFQPDVAQFFEAYAIRDGACVWEMF